MPHAGCRVYNTPDPLIISIHSFILFITFPLQSHCSNTGSHSQESNCFNIVFYIDYFFVPFQTSNFNVCLRFHLLHFQKFNIIILWNENNLSFSIFEKSMECYFLLFFFLRKSLRRAGETFWKVQLIFGQFVNHPTNHLNPSLSLSALLFRERFCNWIQKFLFPLIWSIVFAFNYLNK